MLRMFVEEAAALTSVVLFVGMLAGGFISDAIGARWTWGIAAMLTALTLSST
mgnify:CR=1 FL=1